MATQTLTFLFTAVEGSTTMAGRLRDARAGVLADHHRLVRAAMQRAARIAAVARGGQVVVC